MTTTLMIHGTPKIADEGPENALSVSLEFPDGFHQTIFFEDDLEAWYRFRMALDRTPSYFLHFAGDAVPNIKNHAEADLEAHRFYAANVAKATALAASPTILAAAGPPEDPDDEIPF